MGRSDYIVQAGIGFDLDRSSAKKSIGLFETLAGTLNAVAAKKAKEGFSKADADYAKAMDSIAKTNKKADDDLVKGTKASAQATQKALASAMPKPLTKSAKAKMSKTEVKDYERAFDASMKGMSSSYSKFAKEAEKLGIKVRKAEGGFGTGQSVTDFAKKDVETRNQLIILTKRMIKDEKKKLKGIEEGTKAYDRQLAEVKALEDQNRAQMNLNDDLIQQEKRRDKIKRKSSKDQRKAEKTRISAQKKLVLGLKNLIARNKELGRIATESSKKIAGGLKNAFVIGTAAAAAFFYKMQPLAETVLEFEKTIINANSVFNVTREELHGVSDEMVSFTLKYGVTANEMAEGLYQLASAGLTAAESQEVLQHTMKLAMATQGDHNALAKLTVQTIMGFGMEMTDSAMLVDKFAHSIQKSLIEWDDLASSVKFAMPFFVATGQSIDELLGGLEVLTNRALEAGIAGRGLRQALAQFAKHADDNASALGKLGVEIMDSEGNMRALHEITLDAQAAFGDITDLEALTAMLEDMNVRGATAFALLVQNADEFEAAVGNIANSAGEATLMADIQQESLAMQIQRVKSALLAPFLFSDKVGEANNTLNQFTYYIKTIVDDLVEFFIVVENGEEVLTRHAGEVKTFVIEVLKVAVDVIRQLKDVFLESDEGLDTFTSLITLATKPMMIMLKILDRLGPKWIEYIVWWKVLTSILPISNALSAIAFYWRMKMTAGMISGAVATEAQVAAEEHLFYAREKAIFIVETTVVGQRKQLVGIWAVNHGLLVQAAEVDMLVLSWKAFAMAMMVSLVLFGAAVMTSGALSDALLILAASVALLTIYYTFQSHIAKIPPPYNVVAAIAAAAAMTIAMFAARDMIQKKMGVGMSGGGPGTISFSGASGMSDVRGYDTGGTYMPMRETGGPTTEHGLAWLQKGETVTSKTSNMLEGLTINMGDVAVQDGEDFAERIAQALPDAIRRVSDSGGI